MVMQLDSLRISAETYGPNKGKYNCTVSYTGSYSSHSLMLGHDTSARIIDVIGELLIEASVEMAQNIKPAIEAAQTPAIAAPKAKTPAPTIDPNDDII
jgi:hypothetical protein